MPREQNLAITFLWSGLPDYAARQISEFIQQTSYKVTVIATRPQVPIEGMDISLGQAVIWIDDADKSLSWAGLLLQRPDIVFQAGWTIPAFSILAHEARKSGAKVILMNDQNWVGGIKQNIIDPVRYWLFHLDKFDGVLVAGNSGETYARKVGFSKSRIAQGLYGADPAVFRPGKPLELRPMKFIFAGQLIARKNILALVQAFMSIAHQWPDWSLDIIGSGYLIDDIPTHPQIFMQGFMQPLALSSVLQKSRCLILPSHEEHWGLVVHEAALCGCALALSSSVGSAVDFAHRENSILFPSNDKTALASALGQIASWTDERWRSAELKSLELARNFGPARFAQAATELIVGCST